MSDVEAQPGSATWPSDERGWPVAVPIPDAPPMPPPTAVTFDDLQRSAEIALDRMQTATEALTDIVVRETSDDDEVTVEVNGRGEMTGLWLADAAMSLTGERLGQLIVATANSAAAQAFSQVGQVLTSWQEPEGAAPETSR